jgi:hypothetical protein
VRLPSGNQRLELVNKRLNYRGAVTLEIESGKMTAHTVTLPPGRLRVTSSPGVDVWVEGEHIGTAPVAELAVPLGTREVVVRHPQLGERRQSVDVMFGSVAEASIGFETAASAAPPAPVTPPRLAPLSMPPPPRENLR